MVLGCSSGEGPLSIRLAPRPRSLRLPRGTPLPASLSFVTFALPLPGWRVVPCQCVGRKGTPRKQQTPPSFGRGSVLASQSLAFSAEVSAVAFQPQVLPDLPP